ncbi:hydroxypyruvate isomerase family protein [Paraburkholderia hospita]|uniref:hydroxypyruvate isomerase family protein n=2 Tax=Paraburkholderia hospita TaxID=169430 RepID=UPI001F615A20|nr:TIM barrel protein [Paraburkholderia hospita]
MTMWTRPSLRLRALWWLREKPDDHRPMRRYSANIGTLWSHLPLLKRIEAAACAGFRAVEMHFPYAVAPGEVRKAIEQFDLTLLGINSPPGDLAKGELGLAAIPGREDEFAQSLYTALEYCQASGAQALHIMAGNTAGYWREACLESFRTNMSLAAEVASSCNVRLLLEPLNRILHPDYFYHQVDELAGLLDEVAHPWLKIQFDTYHVGMHHRRVRDVLRRNWSKVGHIQIAAVPDRGEPRAADVDIADVLDEAELRDYTGWIGCEYKPRGELDKGLQWRELTQFSELR